ncbi:MAG: hypothetical protein RJQ09_21090 [Cyclobacteriaceae bacterium]
MNTWDYVRFWSPFDKQINRRRIITVGALINTGSSATEPAGTVKTATESALQVTPYVFGVGFGVEL